MLKITICTDDSPNTIQHTRMYRTAHLAMQDFTHWNIGPCTVFLEIQESAKLTLYQMSADHPRMMQPTFTIVHTWEGLSEQGKQAIYEGFGRVTDKPRPAIPTEEPRVTKEQADAVNYRCAPVTAEQVQEMITKRIRQDDVEAMGRLGSLERWLQQTNQELRTAVDTLSAAQRDTLQRVINLEKLSVQPTGSRAAVTEKLSTLSKRLADLETIIGKLKAL